MGGNEVVSLKGIRKSFGVFEALKGVDLTINKGDFVSIVGPNGAGKSTLMRILAGLMFASSGKTFVMGKSLEDGDAAIRAMIGVVTSQSCLYPSLTAYDNLKFYGRLFQIDKLTERIEEVLKKVGLWERRDSQIKTFSSGMKQRVAIARAIIHKPRLLLLDEPFSALDPVAVRDLMELLKKFREEGKTVVLVTHRLYEGYNLATRLIVMRRGLMAFSKERAGISWEEFNEVYLGESIC
ncbi:MAG: heme ABC exporter ATP-binding protein CcmA [Thermodesulfobacteriota bacterium]